MHPSLEWEVQDPNFRSPGYTRINEICKSTPTTLDSVCDIRTDEDFFRSWISELRTENEELRKNLDVAIQVTPLNHFE